MDGQIYGYGPMYSNEMEADALGAVLNHGSKALDTAPMLRAEHFYNPCFRAAFAVAKSLIEAGRNADVFEVMNRLEADGDGSVKDAGVLVDVAYNSAASDISTRAEAIIERSNARAAVLMAQEFVQAVTESRGSGATAAIAGLARQLDELGLNAEDNDATYDSVELMRIAINQFDERYQNQGRFVGVETGIRQLDGLLMGLQKGSLYVMAGRPGMGKTAVSMTVAENVADGNPQGAVLVFNLEMSKEQLAMRALAAVSEVSLSELQCGSDDHGRAWTKLNNGVQKAAKRKLFVDVRANITIAQIRAKARQIKNRHGLELLVIDYLQLIDEPGRRFKDDNTRVGWLSRQCKMLAKELDVPLILLSQLSRECEKRQDKRPVLSDLRDSGAIEQDADAVIFNYRHGYYTKDSTDDMIELIVAKQRMGETGTAHACFQGYFSRVVDVEDAYVDAVWRKRMPPVNGKPGKQGRGL